MFYRYPCKRYAVFRRVAVPPWIKLPGDTGVAYHSQQPSLRKFAYAHSTCVRCLSFDTGRFCNSECNVNLWTHSVRSLGSHGLVQQTMYPVAVSTSANERISVATYQTHCIVHFRSDENVRKRPSCTTTYSLAGFCLTQLQSN